MRIGTVSAMILCVLAAVMPVGAQATTTTTQVDAALPETILSCTGVPLATSGTVHMVLHETDNAGSHFDIVGNYQNGSAVDTTTGIVYRASSVSIESIQAPSGALTFQAVGTSHLVGQGLVSDLDIVFITHFTVNADGTLTASVENLRAVCRGS